MARLSLRLQLPPHHTDSHRHTFSKVLRLPESAWSPVSITRPCHCALWTPETVIPLCLLQVFVSLSCPDGNLADFLDCFSHDSLEVFLPPFGTPGLAGWGGCPSCSSLQLLDHSSSYTHPRPAPEGPVIGLLRASLPRATCCPLGHAHHLLKNLFPFFDTILFPFLAISTSSGIIHMTAGFSDAFLPRFITLLFLTLP